MSTVIAKITERLGHFREVVGPFKFVHVGCRSEPGKASLSHHGSLVVVRLEHFFFVFLTEPAHEDGARRVLRLAEGVGRSLRVVRWNALLQAHLERREKRCHEELGCQWRHYRNLGHFILRGGPKQRRVL